MTKQFAIQTISDNSSSKLMERFQSGALCANTQVTSTAFHCSSKVAIIQLQSTLEAGNTNCNSNGRHYYYYYPLFKKNIKKTDIVLQNEIITSSN